MEVEGQGAALAARQRATVRLADGDEQRVKLVEERGIGRQVALHEGPDRLVAGIAGKQAVAGQDPPGIRVGNEHWPAGRVEEDRVDRLGPEARHGEQLAAQRPQGRPPEARPATPEAAEEPAGEALQPAGLEPVGPRGTNNGSQRRFVQRGDPLGLQQPAVAQRGHRARGVRPRRVLREHGPHRDLVRCPARPPALVAEAPEQRGVQAQEPGLDGIARRSGKPGG